MRITFRCDPALIDRLERPVPARAKLPDWLKEMPAAAFSELHGTEVRTVKQCPPFVDAMSHGFIMPLPCDIRVSDGRLSWDWDLPPLSVAAHPRSPLSFHVPAQVSGTPFHHADRAIVKFNSFWTIELEEGYAPLRYPSGQPRRPALPLAHRHGRRRSLLASGHFVSGAVDRSRFRRRAATRHSGGAMLSGRAAGARTRLPAFRRDAEAGL